MSHCTLPYNESWFDAKLKRLLFDRELIAHGCRIDVPSTECPANVSRFRHRECETLDSTHFAGCAELSTRRGDGWWSFEVHGRLLGNVGKSWNGCFAQIASNCLVWNDNRQVCCGCDDLLRIVSGQLVGCLVEKQWNEMIKSFNGKILFVSTTMVGVVRECCAVLLVWHFSIYDARDTVNWKNGAK